MITLDADAIDIFHTNEILFPHRVRNFKLHILLAKKIKINYLKAYNMNQKTLFALLLYIEYCSKVYEKRKYILFNFKDFFKRFITLFIQRTRLNQFLSQCHVFVYFSISLYEYI